MMASTFGTGTPNWKMGDGKWGTYVQSVHSGFTLLSPPACLPAGRHWGEGWGEGRFRSLY